MEGVEVELRRQAARRRLAGESPRAIASDLGRTRQWVAKWTARYDPHDPGWADGRSRAPGQVAHRTDAEVEAQVLEVRARLEGNPWAQVGAPAVAWELEKLGAVVPLERTIERILARHGATKRERPGRRAFDGGNVRRMQMVGLRARVISPVSCDRCHLRSPQFAAHANSPGIRGTKAHLPCGCRRAKFMQRRRNCQGRLSKWRAYIDL